MYAVQTMVFLSSNSSEEQWGEFEKHELYIQIWVLIGVPHQLYINDSVAVSVLSNGNIISLKVVTKVEDMSKVPGT